MQRQILILTLFAALAPAGLIQARAETGKESAKAAEQASFKHSQSMPHVNKTLAKHNLQVETPILDKPDLPDALKGNLKQTQVESLSGYLPETGVAVPSNESKKLSAGVQKLVADWFMIPAWLGGRWVKEGDLTVSLKDLKSGEEVQPNEWVENRMESTWGHQKDKAGNLWHVNLLPAQRDGVSAGTKVQFLINQQKCEKSDQQSLITRTHYLVTQSDFASGKPIEIFQQESINHYLPTGSDQVMNISNNRVFDYEGSPIRDGQLHSQLKRIEDFKLTQSLNGVDLKDSLNDFLESQGLKDLVNE